MRRFIHHIQFRWVTCEVHFVLLLIVTKQTPGKTKSTEVYDTDPNEWRDTHTIGRPKFDGVTQALINKTKHEYASAQSMYSKSSTSEGFFNSWFYFLLFFIKKYIQENSSLKLDLHVLIFSFQPTGYLNLLSPRNGTVPSSPFSANIQLTGSMLPQGRGNASFPQLRLSVSGSNSALMIKKTVQLKSHRSGQLTYITENQFRKSAFIFSQPEPDLRPTFTPYQPCSTRKVVYRTK